MANFRSTDYLKPLPYAVIIGIASGFCLAYGGSLTTFSPASLESPLLQ